jgi:hypothetical protein
MKFFWTSAILSLERETDGNVRNQSQLQRKLGKTLVDTASHRYYLNSAPEKYKKQQQFCRFKLLAIREE